MRGCLFRRRPEAKYFLGSLVIFFANGHLYDHDYFPWYCYGLEPTQIFFGKIFQLRSLKHN